jgi:hypothetical protein
VPPTCDVIKCVKLPWGCGISCKNMQKSFTHEHEKSNDYEFTMVQGRPSFSIVVSWVSNF